MKLKLLTILLGISTVVLGCFAFLFYLKSNIRAERIVDRELTITNYQKVVNAIGRSGNIPIDKLKIELKREFDVDEKIGYNNYNKEYYYTLSPKKYDVNSKGIWTFMGLELILDKKKEFKTIGMYKP